MARVLWWGDAGCHTGFARVTHSIGDRLVRDYGHEVSVLAVNHLGDWWNTPMRLFRANKMSPTDVYGQTRIVELLADVMPEAIVILNDPVPTLKFLLQNKNDPSFALRGGGPMKAPIIAYVPIDGHNYTPALESLGGLAHRVAMTRYGESLMPGSTYIPHGVDTATYRPLSVSSPMTTSGGKVITSQREAKQAFGYDPDSFLVLRVDRNSHRKAYPDTWKALVPVMKRHSDIVVHFQCVARDEYNLDELVWREPELRQRIYFGKGLNTFTGWPEGDLAILYNAADVFVSTSWGEGFGLTLAEAAACGTPVIAQNVSAIPEVVGPGGRFIEPQREAVVPMGHEQWQPDVAAFSKAIESLYLAGGSRRKMGEAGRRHIVDSYSWDEAAKGFDLVIREQIELRSGRGSQAGSAEPGADPGRAVQHRDAGDDGEAGRGRPPDPALHGLVNG